MADLGGVEGHGEIGVDRGSLGLAGRRRRRRRRCRRRRSAHQLSLIGGDRRVGGLARSAVEAGAEDRVDDRPRARQRALGLALAKLAPAAVEPLEVGGRVVAELVGRPQQQDLHAVAGPLQQARGDQAVAAVVALAADDPDRARRGRSASVSATAAPAASISSSEGIPRSSIAQRSIALMPSASRSGASHRRTPTPAAYPAVLPAPSRRGGGSDRQHDGRGGLARVRERDGQRQPRALGARPRPVRGARSAGGSCRPPSPRRRGARSRLPAP